MSIGKLSHRLVPDAWQRLMPSGIWMALGVRLLMSVDSSKDEGLERLLQEIARTLEENQRFIKRLKDDRMDESEETDEPSGAEEEFEEL
jgi:hypothetical protein